MTVVEDTDARLVLRHRPWVMVVLTLAFSGSIIWGLVFSGEPVGRLMQAVLALIALGLLWVVHRHFPLTHTVFDRRSGVVVHAERRVTGQRLTTWPLSDIEGAEVEANWSENSRTTRLTLRIGGKRVPLEGGSGPADRRAVETAVNDWLTRPAA